MTGCTPKSRLFTGGGTSGNPKEDKVLTGWVGGHPRRLHGGGWNPRWAGAAERSVKGTLGRGHSLGKGVTEGMYKAEGVLPYASLLSS